MLTLITAVGGLTYCMCRALCWLGLAAAWLVWLVRDNKCLVQSLTPVTHWKGGRACLGGRVLHGLSVAVSLRKYVFE